MKVILIMDRMQFCSFVRKVVLDGALTGTRLRRMEKEVKVLEEGLNNRGTNQCGERRSFQVPNSQN